MNIQLERCLVQVQFLFSHVIPVSNPLVQGRGQSRWTSPEGLGGSGRPPRRGCRPPPGRAGGSQGSTRWGCSLNTFVLTTTREGRTLEFLRQLDFRTFRLITFLFHVLSSFLVKLCCIILAAKVFQYLKSISAGHYCKPIEGCQTQTDRPPLQSKPSQTKTSSAKVFHTKFSSTNKHRRGEGGGRCYIACNQWLHCGVGCYPVRCYIVCNPLDY